METITELQNYNWFLWIIGTLMIFAAIKYGAGLISWVFSFFGIEFKWMRKRHEEHDLLVQTAQNLSLLQKRHEEDIKNSDEHDHAIEQKLSACITEIKDIIKDNRNDTHEFIENRLVEFYTPYREQSLKVQAEWIKTQKDVSDKVVKLSEQLNTMQKNTDERFRISEEKQNKRARAELKDKIRRSYQMYHESGKINDMEIEALEGLIESYEDAKGDNSFVHSVVQKEMYTWERI